METKNVIHEPNYNPVIDQLAKLCKARKDETEHDHAFKNLR